MGRNRRRRLYGLVHSPPRKSMIPFSIDKVVIGEQPRNSLLRRRAAPRRAKNAAILAFAVAVAVAPLRAQYDKVAALGSDSSLTPIGGPASSPPLAVDRYDLPDFRPTGKLNDGLPQWLKFGLDERFRFEGFSGGSKPSHDSYFLNRLRLGMLLQPAAWFKVVAQVQDARSFLETAPVGPPNNTRWDLKLAYAQFGDAERQPISVTIGRQLIDYNNTIIGNSEWRNQARSYDGVTANVRVDRVRVAAFAASVVIPSLDGLSHHQEGNNIYGAYGWITRVLPKSSVEPFVLWRVAPSVPVEASSAKSGRLDEQAYGLRVRGTRVANFDYRGELVLERGRAGPNSIGAWAATAALGYTLRALSWKPRFFTGYDYASGDKNPTDGMRGTFDSMYPTAHDRFGISDQFGWQNIVAWRVGATVIPHRRWSVTAQYIDLWLAAAADGVYNSSGGLIFRDATARSGRHVGNELDTYSWYEINRQLHIGAGIGRLFPGEFMAKAGKNTPYTYPYLVLEMLDGKRVR